MEFESRALTLPPAVHGAALCEPLETRFMRRRGVVEVASDGAIGHGSGYSQ